MYWYEFSHNVDGKLRFFKILEKKISADKRAYDLVSEPLVWFYKKHCKISTSAVSYFGLEFQLVTVS